MLRPRRGRRRRAARRPRRRHRPAAARRGAAARRPAARRGSARSAGRAAPRHAPARAPARRRSRATSTSTGRSSVAGGRPRDAGDLVARQFAAAPRSALPAGGPQRVDARPRRRDRRHRGGGGGARRGRPAALQRGRLRRRAALLLDARAPRPGAAVVDDLLSLRGHGTDGSRARAARRGRAARPRAARRRGTAVLLSDCLRTAGDDPLPAAGALDRLHVLGTSRRPTPSRPARRSPAVATAAGCPPPRWRSSPARSRPRWPEPVSAARRAARAASGRCSSCAPSRCPTAA